MMRVVNHGGRCCGIKHIMGFPSMPSDKVSALTKREVFHGGAGEMKNPAKDFFPGPEPMEAAGERLKKILTYIDEQKTSHLVEVVLQTTWVVPYWKKTLGDHGFKVVSVFTNSNTSTRLTVFHRVTPLPKPRPEKKVTMSSNTEGE